MRAAQKLAMASTKVTTACIELSHFPELATEYRVRGVPKSVFNRTEELLGAAPEAAFVAKILAAGS